MYSGSCEYSQNFEVQYCVNFRARIISVVDALLWIPPALASIWEFWTARTASTGSISSVGTASIPSKMLSTCAVYVLGVWTAGLPTIYAPFRYFHPHFYAENRKSSQMVPQVGIGAKLLWEGATGVLPTSGSTSGVKNRILRVLVVFPGSILWVVWAPRVFRMYAQRVYFVYWFTRGSGFCVSSYSQYSRYLGLH